jgi:uncharacterized membrane protein YbaN (DUF454 family)
MTTTSTGIENLDGRSRPVRWLLAALGCVCVALGAIGAVVPGLPTTIFLIAAAWLFARSCPALERRLLESRLGGSLRRFRETGAMTPRAKATAVGSMWLGIGFSMALTVRNGWTLPLVLAGLGLIGSATILFWVRTLPAAATASAVPVREDRRAV